MKLEFWEGEPWVVLRLAAGESPEPEIAAHCLAVIRTPEETTLVIPASLPGPNTAECSPPWGCFRVAGCLDFEMVGVLAKLTGILAAAEVPVFVLSSYDTDYVLIPEPQRWRARDVLLAAGYSAGTFSGQFPEIP